MRIEDGPAAVTGDISCVLPLGELSWEGVEDGLIRKSEDLPEMTGGSPVEKDAWNDTRKIRDSPDHAM